MAKGSRFRVHDSRLRLRLSDSGSGFRVGVGVRGWGSGLSSGTRV